MRLQMSFRCNDEVSDDARSRAEEKLRGLERFNSRLESLEVVCSDGPNGTLEIDAVAGVHGEQPVVCSAAGHGFVSVSDELCSRLSRTLRKRREKAREHQGLTPEERAPWEVRGSRREGYFQDGVGPIRG